MIKKNKQKKNKKKSKRKTIFVYFRHEKTISLIPGFPHLKKSNFCIFIAFNDLPYLRLAVFSFTLKVIVFWKKKYMNLHEWYELHTTSFWRPYNVHNVKTTLYGLQNNVLCVLGVIRVAPLDLSLIHIWRCRRSTLCRSRWSPYH